MRFFLSTLLLLIWGLIVFPPDSHAKTCVDCNVGMSSPCKCGHAQTNKGNSLQIYRSTLDVGRAAKSAQGYILDLVNRGKYDEALQYLNTADGKALLQYAPDYEHRLKRLIDQRTRQAAISPTQPTPIPPGTGHQRPTVPVTSNPLVLPPILSQMGEGKTIEEILQSYQNGLDYLDSPDGATFSQQNPGYRDFVQSMIDKLIASMQPPPTDNGFPTNPDYAGGPAQTVPPPACMKLAYAPSDKTIAEDCTRNPRVSNVTNAPGGVSAVRMFAPGGGAAQTLAQCNMSIPGARETKPKAARLCTEMYVPNDGSSYGKGAGGRAFFGMSVNTGKPVPGGLAGNGGTPPQLQNSANIRANRTADGKFSIYSYHLNRSDQGKRDHANRGYLGANSNRTVPYLHYGEGKNMSVQYPRGQWFTMCLDVVVNTFDARGNPQANGLARLSMFDNGGKLISASELPNAVFARDPSGYVQGLNFDEKWNDQYGNKGVDSNTYYRNYQVFFPDASKPECK